MASSYNLTTEQGLIDYLAATRRENPRVELLSGGTANYVYRSTREDGSTSIFKHAAPYLHSNSNFAFDPTRMDYEANILAMLSSENRTLLVNPPNTTVHAARLLSYDKARKLLEIEDGGSRNLKEAYTDSALDIPHIGQELAAWLAALHTSSTAVSLALPDEDKNTENSKSKNNHIAVNIYRYSYNGLHTALEKFSYAPDLAHAMNAEFGSLLATDNECVCHGDFWPGNVLVHTHDNTANNAMQLTIADWEMVRRGTSATDVGQFAAEAFLLDRFRGGRGLRVAFLRAYVAARGGSEVLGKTWLRRMLVHCAVHVAFWPVGVQWCDDEGTKRLVDIGVQALESIRKDDWERALESPLLGGVKEVFLPILDRP
ncbi:hypothetical protein ACJQWK_09424 [Exserohilum turcicum]|uniref:Aminoglycoside phosphotransferase domain-containing protein n=1 Tax=Exserohilum turcicum (strain 28A) TaxID=671987 RepID=R0IWX9_EXST2|nr:uncharacterized protein SETTUDRAFT_127885 [Exserohilum turcica Et28A]EOA89270.1 hypothetical protein SETTUDRAFT_127885 [Exserohilum turcica Et28A]